MVFWDSLLVTQDINMEKDKKVNKEAMKHSMGRMLTQGLFLEFGYNTDHAQFTIDDEDKEYEGQTYISLKKRYIEFGDLAEYDFANKYLLGWKHWMKMCNNAQIREHIDQWREELELSIRSEALRAIIDQAAVKDSFQAAKFLVDRGWDKRAAGRPTKEEVERRVDRDAKFLAEFDTDVAVLEDYKKVN